VADAPVVSRAQDWIESHLATARRVTLDECARSLWHRWFADGLGLFVARFAQWFGRVLAFRR